MLFFPSFHFPQTILFLDPCLYDAAHISDIIILL